MDTCFNNSVSELFANEFQMEQVKPEEKKNILFEILNAIFTNKAYIDSLTNETAKQNIFMVNRRIAIKYPIHAQEFNKSGMDPKSVLIAWSTFLYCGSTPKWLYTPGATKTKTVKESSGISESVMKKYAAYYDLSMKDMKSCMQLFPEETEKELKAFMKFQKELAKNEESDK